MYKDEVKAFLMTKDKNLSETMKSYLFDRYNLATETAEEIIDVFNRLAADDTAESSWDLVILDETVAGLQTTSQALKTLKSRYSHINVLYLSTILETAAPYNESEMKLSPDYEDEDYRSMQIDNQLDKLIALLTPVTQATSLKDVYETIPKAMINVYPVDWALCAVLRLDEKPLRRGVAASDFPQILSYPCEFPLKGTGYLEEMLFNFKPVHIPDLNEDEAFRRELEEKFSSRYRSALLLPMQYDGNYIGFLGLFTANRTRLYLLPDLDLLQRLADMCTVAIITHLYREHSNVDIDKLLEDVRSGNRWGDWGKPE
jgi:GAF domain-containing protein